MFFILNISLSLIFILLKHPMTMGLTLLMQTILVSLITGSYSINFWFSYILFLIMIGGLLVLFIYMTSIASNELFNYSSKILMLMLMLMISMMMLYFWLDNYFINMTFSFKEMITMSNYNNSMNKFFNYPTMFIIIFMIIYLLITLIAIVKITKIECGPLRQMF